MVIYHFFPIRPILALCGCWDMRLEKPYSQSSCFIWNAEHMLISFSLMVVTLKDFLFPTQSQIQNDDKGYPIHRFPNQMKTPGMYDTWLIYDMLKLLINSQYAQRYTFQVDNMYSLIQSIVSWESHSQSINKNFYHSPCL